LFGLCSVRRGQQTVNIDRKTAKKPDFPAKELTGKVDPEGAMAKIPYHVFKKPKKTADGKPYYRWYYYYTDTTGKRVQKACIGCRNRQDAENYIRELPALDGAPGACLIKDIAAEMYLPGSAHVSRRRQLGKTVNMETLIEARRYIDEILKLWEEAPLKDIDADSVMDHLFSVNRSGSWKNRFLSVLKEIYIEAPRYGYKAPAPAFPSFARNSKKADTFTGEELDRLFKTDNFPDNQFFLFFLLILSAGLRLGEARAVKVKQILFDKKALIVDGFCKKSSARTVYNKKGSPDNPKLRAAWLPDYTLNLLKAFLKNKTPESGPDDFVFASNGTPLKQETCEMVFMRALVKAGIAKTKNQLIKEGTWEKGHIIKKSAIIEGDGN
jgi:integrase